MNKPSGPQPTQSPLRAHVVTCVWRDIDIDTSMAIARLMSSRDPLYSWSRGRDDALIERVRSEQATIFLQNPSLGDVLLSIDGDIYFKPEDAALICREAVDLDIVGGLYATRSQEKPRPAVRVFPNTNIQMGFGDPIEVCYVSTGFTAVHRRVFERMAKELPFCVSNSQEFYPFYMCSIKEHPEGKHEFLSEDWAYCERATQLGFKCYIEPKVRLVHQGVRGYVVEDIIARNFTDFTYTISEGSLDKTNLLADLAEYRGISKSELVPQLEVNLTAPVVKAQWDSNSPQTPQDFREFYSNCSAYIMDLAAFNLSPEYWDRCRIPTMLTGSIIDFGGGIGTLSIYLAEHSRKPVYIDFPSPQRSFAEWRFKKHGLQVPVFSTLDGLQADHLVAVDVMEHIHPEDLPNVVRAMYKAINPGGYAVCINSFGSTPEHPMHQDTDELFVQCLQEVGFKGGPYKWQKPLR